ncbi:DUF1476 domain-containing protein [Thalassospira sp. MA62]|nr:DUF1476 domain-containing protein [Thalassospira sp. MA62]
MGSFNDRERGFEAKYSFDLEQDFRVEAHLFQKLATWAGEKMGMSPEDCRSYAAKVVGDVVTNPRGNSLIGLIMADFQRENVAISESDVTAKLEELRPIARTEVLSK